MDHPAAIRTADRAAAADPAAADPAADPAARTPAGPPVRVVPVGEDRAGEVVDLDRWAFAADAEDVDAEMLLRGMEWDRTAGAVIGDDDTLAGIMSVRSLRMQVPGGDVPTAGLTWVGVHPQHRRRGVLTAMMHSHLLGVHDAGREPVSALWAAEPAIYGRYGYGLATLGARLTLPRGAGLRDVPGADDLAVTLERADPARHVDVVAQGYEAARAGRPGAMARDSAGLRREPLDDPPPRGWRGTEALRLLTVRDAAGALRGYALFRRKPGWGQTGPDGEVTVQEAHALDAAAARALWGRLVDMDLMASTRTDTRAVDDALLHLLLDVRAARITVSDGLWVRLVDVDRALAARRYTTDVDVVVEVIDRLCPWNAGRHHLVAGPDGASCRPTQRPADLRCDVDSLGSAYLGGQTLAAQAAAGRVQEVTPGALPAASAALAWHLAPHCGWEF